MQQYPNHSFSKEIIIFSMHLRYIKVSYSSGNKAINQQYESDNPSWKKITHSTESCPYMDIQSTFVVGFSIVQTPT